MVWVQLAELLPRFATWTPLGVIGGCNYQSCTVLLDDRKKQDRDTGPDHISKLYEDNIIIV